MKKRIFRLPDTAAIILGLGLLLAAGLFAAFLPHADFSDAERRYLSSAPSAPSLTNWRTDKEIESYLSDRIPLRTTLVGIDAAANVYTGRRTQLETWPVYGAFLEQPITADASIVTQRLAQLEEVAQKVGAPWHILVPPTHGYLIRNNISPLLGAQYEVETPLYEALAAADEAIICGDVVNKSAFYYNTDHHWSSTGVIDAYLTYCGAVGLIPLHISDIELTDHGDFHGTTYSRSGYPFANADQLTSAVPQQSNVHLTILDDSTEYDSLIFPEHADTYDGYAIFLGGNHGMLEITNAAAPEGTLLVFKDSFANSLLPLLSAHYSRIVVVDARYYAGNFSDAIAAAGKVDQVLYVYSMDSLVNDTVVARKITR